MRAGLSVRSLRSLFSHSRWGSGGMTGELRLCADQGVCYRSNTIKRQTKVVGEATRESVFARCSDGREQDCVVPPQGAAVVRLQHSVHETSWQEPPNLVHQACGSRSTTPKNNWHGVALLESSR
jgi:hypothetical protein